MATYTIPKGTSVELIFESWVSPDRLEQIRQVWGDKPKQRTITAEVFVPYVTKKDVTYQETERINWFKESDMFRFSLPQNDKGIIFIEAAIKDVIVEKTVKERLNEISHEIYKIGDRYRK